MGGGQFDRAGFLRRPAVPSRARVELLTGGHELCVFEELAIDGVGDPALEAPDRLEELPALGSLASVVTPAVGFRAGAG
jgi:hypothetical protein